jgi:UDP-N-acetylglucosamine pyrophosphorylase
MDFDAIKKYGQEQVLQFWDELDDAGREKLSAQLAVIDLEHLEELAQEYVLKQPEAKIPDDLSPASFFPLIPRDAEQQELYNKARQAGQKLIADGKIAALTVAGGQGSRLGFDGPKGTYPLAPVSGKTLFQYFAESIVRIREKYDTDLNWYIMTSGLNHQQTVDFFTENDFFGLGADTVFFFTQGTMPAIGYDGKLLLAEKDSLALAPDGHGGTLLALHNSGCLEKMKNDGVEFISYFQVDNPLVSIVNELFLGLHALEESEMSAIMLSKTGPYEKLGNFCMSQGRLQIIEYSDLPDELAEQTNPDGSLSFIAGSPAIHVLSLDFVERLTATGRLELPWHRADKKVSYLDADGTLVTPEEPNGVKLEAFIFDALPLARKTVILEADRHEEFAPTKNKTGVDSVESCRKMMIERDCARLERVGVKIPRDADCKPSCAVEISPRIIIDDADAAAWCAECSLTELEESSGGIYLK